MIVAAALLLAGAGSLALIAGNCAERRKATRTTTASTPSTRVRARRLSFPRRQIGTGRTDRRHPEEEVPAAKVRMNRRAEDYPPTTKFSDDLLKAASGGSEKESRTKSRTNAIWPELIGLEVHQRRIRALRQRAKTGPHEIRFNSGKTKQSQPAGREYPGDPQGCEWSEDCCF